MARPATFPEIWRSRGIVLRLAQAELRNRYSGSALGVLWALIQPAMVMAVFWFVFSYGLRVTSPEGEPAFVARLLVGLAAWFCFSEAVSNGAHAVTGSAYLVKKVAFPLELLPLAPVIAAVMVHLGVLACLVAGLALGGSWGGWRLLHLPLYLAAVSLLAAGFAYWLAALQVFQRDVAQTATLLLQIWFWMTPIVWSFAMFPPEVATVLGWNPMAYVVDGYRYALLPEVAAPPALHHALSFWLTACLLFASGVAMFRRLRADFADVL